METLEQTTTRARKMLDQTQAQGSAPFAGSSYDTLNSDTIKPEAQLNVSQPKPATKAAELTGVFEAQADSFTQNLNTQATTAEASKNTALTDYLNQLKGAPTQAGLTAEAYKKEVDPTALELNNIYDQMRQEQMGLRRRMEAIDRNGGGLQGAAEAEKRNAERESISRQADLAVIAQAVQGRYDIAKSIADRAVEAKLEEYQNVTDALRMNYEENKALFDKTEQRAFEVMLNDRNRTIEMEANKEMARFEQMIRQNDPLYKAQLNGQYLNNQMQQAELEAYQKAQEAAQMGILTPEQMGTANSINKDFSGEPVVKQYNEMLTKQIALEGVLKNGVSGVQDLTLVYEYMKALDPTSVVREAEFNNAAESGNIFAGAFAKFNKGYFGSGGFLPDNVKQSFLGAIKSRQDAVATQYFNVKGEYAKRVNNTVGVQNGADYLTAYEGAAPLVEADFTLAKELEMASPQDIQDIMNLMNSQSTPSR